MDKKNNLKEAPQEVLEIPERLPQAKISKALLILGGSLILAIGLTVGYYFAQSSKPVANSQITPSPTLSPEAGDEMEGWKTYVNEDKNTLVSTPTVSPNPTSQTSIKTIQHSVISGWGTHTSKAGYTIQYPTNNFKFESETREDTICKAYFNNNIGGLLSAKVVPYSGGSRRELYGISAGNSYIFEDVNIQGVKGLIIDINPEDYSGSGSVIVIPKGKYALILSWDHRRKDDEDFQNLLKSISITELTNTCE